MANVNLRFLWARFFSLTSDQFVGSWLFCWNRKWIWVPSREPVIRQVLNCPSPRIEWKDKKNVPVERLYSPSTEIKGKLIWPRYVEVSWFQSPWSTSKTESRCTVRGKKLFTSPRSIPKQILVKRGLGFFCPQLHIHKATNRKGLEGLSGDQIV